MSNQQTYIFQFTEKLDKQRRDLGDIITLMEENKTIINENTLEELQEISKEFEKMRNDYKAQLQTMLIAVRADEEEMSAISELISTFIDNDYSPENIAIKLEDYEEDLQRINVIKEWREFTSIKGTPRHPEKH